MKKNNLVVIVPFYKRPELTKLCFQRLKRQSKKLGFDVIVAGSEGEESKKLAKGLKYIEVPNQPLGKKLNALLQECKEYDGVVVMGSDDFMSDSIIKLYQEADCSEEVYYVFEDCYVYSAKYREVRSDLNYKSRPSGVGIGRLLTKASLEKIDYHLWENYRRKGLDGSAHRKFKANNIKPKWVDLGKHFLIDIKVENNITSHEVVKLRGKEHDLSIIPKHLGKIGEKILEMEAGNERIYKGDRNAKATFRIMCRVNKEFNGHKKGTKIILKERNYKRLLKSGYVIPLTE